MSQWKPRCEHGFTHEHNPPMYPSGFTWCDGPEPQNFATIRAEARRQALDQAIRIAWDEEASSVVERLEALAAQEPK